MALKASPWMPSTQARGEQATKVVASIVARGSRSSFPLVRVLGTANPDFPLSVPSKAISGTIYLPDYTPAAGVTAKLFRQADDKLIATQTTNANGQYLFLRDANDTHAYYVIGYGTTTSPQVHGTSDRGQVPA